MQQLELHLRQDSCSRRWTTAAAFSTIHRMDPDFPLFTNISLQAAGGSQLGASSRLVSLQSKIRKIIIYPAAAGHYY